VNVHRVTALALVITVLLAGCSGIGSISETPAPTETSQATITPSATAIETTTPTQTATSTPTSTPTPYVATPPPTPKSTPTEEWTQPPTPKSPEDKLEDRFIEIKFINKEKASNGNGYTDFDVQVTANTFFSNVDPTPSEDGEPYLAVFINGQIVARDEVRLRKEGTFTLDIKPGALALFNSGTLNVRVSLYDDDHKHHDRYDTWTGTIRYVAPDNSSNSNSNSTNSS
jgi:hypothetical protein